MVFYYDCISPNWFTLYTFINMITLLSLFGGSLFLSLSQTPPSSPTTSTGSRKSSICSLGSINSSDSRSSGSMNSHSPSSNHYHRHRSMSQPNPSHRLSSVSSQDSGFTSQDTIYLRPGTPPHSDMTQVLSFITE